MSNLLEQAKKMPTTAGCYLFKDESQVVLYVGKAKNIRKRVGQYFGQDKRAQLPFLIADASRIDFISTSTELEAMFLESTLIKKYSPKYNIDLKDDKSFAFIKIDYNTQIPQITYTRNPDTGRGAKTRENLFGPYSSVKKIRDTLDLIRRIFTFCANETVSSRPCFYYHLHRCPGVCIGQISLEEYQNHLRGIRFFLNGQTREVRQGLEYAMLEASNQKQFEKAARMRDQIKGLDILHEKQVVQVGININWDIINIATKSAYACVNILKLREGKLTDSENFVLNNFGQIPEKLILEIFLENYLTKVLSPGLEIYTSNPLSNKEMLDAILLQNGFKTKLKVAKESKVKKLANLSKLNAEQYLEKQQKSLAQDKDVLNAAMKNLQEILKLKSLPRRIECFDMSNIQGTNPVGSMVVFLSGQPAKAEYKKFKVKSKDTPDDFAMMEEVLTRRLAHSLAPQNEKSKWPIPDLIVIDGGKGQLNAALKALRKFKGAQVPIIGLAKRLEEIFIPGNSSSIQLSHEDPSLQLLQRLRDEAHRFAIIFHRQLRSKQAVKSRLDSIPGIGPKTKKLLKIKFGTVAHIKSATLDELADVVGESKANIIKQNL